MPRGNNRGGARQGTPGTAYSNRTDLNLPISTVPGQEYGAATAQRQAQRTVPMAQQNTPPVESAPTPTAAKPASALPQPGSMPYIAPTQRPNEPVTAGLPFGPGPGPEALGAQTLNASQHLADAARMSGSPTLSNLAAIASLFGD